MPRMVMIRVLALLVLLVTGGYFIAFGGLPGDQVTAEGGVSVPGAWIDDFPKTDFSNHAVPFDDIRSGGPKRDVIPAIDAPTFAAASAIGVLKDDEPVISLALGGAAKAYPLRILMWHEVVNDTIGGVPVAVTYSPLLNAGLVFERTVDGQTLDFGVSGRLRRAGSILYDRQSESWWQQFTGEGIVGAHAGRRLTAIPARLEAFSRFKARFPDGKVLVPNDPTLRDYGANPYDGYDTAKMPPAYDGPLDQRIAPMARVVIVDGRAWAQSLIEATGRLEDGDLVMTWEPGQLSALDAPNIVGSRDVGNVVVQRRQADGTLIDVVHTVGFAFAFKAFHPDGALRIE